MAPRTLRFDGWIAGASFASGDSFVLGAWPRSPFGPFADLMWSAADGTTTLHTPREEVASFVSDQYRFDHVAQTAVSLRRRGPDISAASGEVELDLTMAPPRAASLLLALRPRSLRTAPWWISFEDRLLRPLARPFVGDVDDIRTTGKTATGAREWYAIHDLRTLAGATATVRGIDLGDRVRRQRRTGFGFSEFPADGGLVRVTSLIESLDEREGVPCIW